MIKKAHCLLGPLALSQTKAASIVPKKGRRPRGSRPRGSLGNKPKASRGTDATGYRREGAGAVSEPNTRYGVRGRSRNPLFG